MKLMKCIAINVSTSVNSLQMFKLLPLGQTYHPNLQAVHIVHSPFQPPTTHQPNQPSTEAFPDNASHIDPTSDADFFGCLTSRALKHSQHLKVDSPAGFSPGTKASPTPRQMANERHTLFKRSHLTLFAKNGCILRSCSVSFCASLCRPFWSTR